MAKKKQVKRKREAWAAKKKMPYKKRRKRRTKQQIAEAQARRRDRENTAPGRGVTTEDRVAVFDYYGRACLACGKRKKKMCLDHVVALYEGGRHDPDNLQPMCWTCNKKKGLKTVDYRPKPYPF